MPKNLAELLEQNPVVAAVKTQDELQKSLACESGMVFLLYGSILELPHAVEAVRAAGKLAIVHVDLVDGLSPREAAVDYIKSCTMADGVISTRAGLVRYARARGLIAIQRFFIFDSMSLETTRKQMPLEYADAIEILPGTMPGVIRELSALTPRPVIAGGLITRKEDVLTALGAGAAAISTTNEQVWFL